MSQTIIDAINTSPLNRGLDGRAWLLTQGNIPITFDNGDVVLFDLEGPNEYQGHLLMKSRGRTAINHLKEAFRRMFSNHNAELIIGIIPDIQPAAKLVVRLAGGKSIGKRNTSEGVCEIFTLSSDMWKKVNQYVVS